MGLKDEAVQEIGFQRLAIFRPGIIAGNAHTPRDVAWLGRLIRGSFGAIEQDDIGGAPLSLNLLALGPKRDCVSRK
jgi:hypothetical protein